MKPGCDVRGVQLKNRGGQAENKSDTFSLLDESNTSNCKKQLLAAQIDNLTTGTSDKKNPAVMCRSERGIMGVPVVLHGWNIALGLDST